MKELITANLDIWSSAVTAKTSGAGRSSGNKGSYGINKLRELILEQAVRGKLVPQDPSDEPASELLKRIQKKREQLIATGVIKKDKAINSDLILSLNNLKILRYLFRNNFWPVLSDVYRFTMTKQEELELVNILSKYTENIIERKINSFSYLEKIYSYGNKVMAGIK